MTVALGTNIANPISTALSQWLGFDTMGKLANYGKLGAAADPDAVIKALFANSEQGAWYDPSDLTTMFRDRAGTIQVTADGQTVGLILDKSKGLVLGPETVTNGTFDTNNTGWTQVNANTGSSSVIAGELNIVAGGGGSGGFTQDIAVTQGQLYKISITARKIAGAGAARGLVYDGASFATELIKLFDVSTVAAEVTYTAYVKATLTSTIRIYLYADTSTTTGINTVTLKSVAGNHAVAPNDSARPLYKTSGGLHWLQFDGVNNSLSSAAINFSSTDKMSVFSGVRKLTNTGDQMFLELGPGGGAGSFYNLGPAGGGQNYQFALSGSVDATSTLFTATTFNAPIKNVLSVLYDTAGALRADEIKPRVNGVVPTLAGGGGASCGSGAFGGSFSLYIGSRAGTSVYFNGNIYSVIVLGRTATTQEITDTETWVNGKTNAY